MPFVFLDKIARNDAAVKSIFDNVRNLGLCAAVFAASAWKLKHIGSGWLYYFDSTLGWLLFAAGFSLTFINMNHGLYKLKESALPKWLKGLIGGLYGALAIEVINALLSGKFGG
ncbi:MAG TPA: hypothetical protein VGK14_09035 [Novimethylophilus sp.]|jgi:hypothetical protein|uniref:hypothetical protein n=1 Tax=Novimethylophilus sp. TaxID=2137426 RepID=UPI002F40A1EF